MAIVAGLSVVILTAAICRYALPQTMAVKALTGRGAIVLYDFEYDFGVANGRIPSYQRPPAPPLLLRVVFGNDCCALPVYAQIACSANRNLDVETLVDSLTALTSVRHLNLGGVCVDDQSIPHLSQLHQLRVLDIRTSMITENGLSAIKAALPNCQVLYAGESHEASGE